MKPVVTEREMEVVSESELASCLSTLRKLKSSDIELADESASLNLREIRSVGLTLFGRLVRKECFKDKDVLHYLQENKGVKKKINQLSRLHGEVIRAHASLVEENSCAGINAVRESKTQEVNTAGLVTMTSDYAAITLNESFKLSCVEDGLEAPAAPPLRIDNESEDKTSSEEGNDTAVSAHSVKKSKSKAVKTKEFRFDLKRVRGLFDDVSGESEAVRRHGEVYLLPRGGSTEGGWIGFVLDKADGLKRACSLRAVEILRLALEKLEKPLEAGKMVAYNCSYVVGERQQRWAYLGGAIEGLSGETAMSIQLQVDDLEITSSSSSSALHKRIAASPEDSESPETPTPESLFIPPSGSFRRYCNICKQPYLKIHFFYHQLCVACGDFNYDKRMSTCDLRGRVCLLTGGRVRIGYQIALKLLRAGATVVVTTRWAYDAALRYSYESDFEDFSSRLHIDQVELSDLEETERYCRYLETNYKSIDILINNAAQTLTRPQQWTDKMNVLEVHASKQLCPLAAELLTSPWMRAKPFLVPPSIIAQCEAYGAMTVTKAGEEELILHPGVRRVFDPNNGGWLTYDESGQPLDLSGVNSWSRRCGEVGVSEMAQTMAVNAMAPFILCSRLKPLLMPQSSEEDEPIVEEDSGRRTMRRRYNHIVNVTALEGKFNVGKKSGGHPHVSMQG